MRKTLMFGDNDALAAIVGDAAAANIADGQADTFESFPDYNLIAFKWCDVKALQQRPERVIVYSDVDKLVVVCGGQNSFNRLSSNEDKATNLTAFLRELISGDVGLLENLEGRLYSLERRLLNSADQEAGANPADVKPEAHSSHKSGKKTHRDVAMMLLAKKELLQFKTYYEELDAILDETLLNDNGCLNDDELRRLNIIHSRVNRLLSSVLDLREYLNHVWEAYQTQIDIEQNRLMKFFTVITSVFMPLTLITGWYGMNFVNMPELSWQHGYLSVIVLSAAICIFIAVYFRKRKWM